MTNPIIPFTFIPGTKAKAEEVNQNFTSVAEKIDSVEANTYEKLNSITNTFETEFENLNQYYSDVNLSNTGVISNCILEAPNGIAEYENSKVTVKSGLKLLIPNGRDEKFKLKNIVYTLPSDLDITVTDFGDSERVLFVTNSNSFITTLSQYYFVQTEEPKNPTSSNFVWFNPQTNTLKQYNIATEQWDIILATKIGNITTKSELVKDIKTNYPINLLDLNDKKEICKWNMPSDKYIDLTRGASGTEYTAPANGYAFLRIRFTNSGNQLEVNRYMDNTLIQGSTLRSYGGGYIAVTLPVQKNQIFRIDYGGTIDTSAPLNIFRFIYAQGESEE